MKVNDKLKPFTAKDQNEEEFDISKHLGKTPLVIYFYPKNFTPGCTKEACSFRDSYQDFQDLGAEVIGVSGDSESSHQRFAKKHNLPFTLLSDKDGKLRKQFGVKKSLLGLLPGRETFIFDDDGVLIHRFNSMDAKPHIRKALKVVKKINT
ncbi:peroxiredoxin [Mesohalobacter halotolerans]|uniref:thioredoxin-dependent peroxiredoxin n=1 Tax=Mesohalobacter halotolerans TaxID=1883405 RepID=A0A4U5TS33_9FLAO|nr:peroxiredoxin [Mesohalobacter halotolerans]MBS3739552.1 peroxiredoxin [Psychroflexus sp.]TKS56651.1 peroxiredoxin [Mesohalobacter halotolerans]